MKPVLPSFPKTAAITCLGLLLCAVPEGALRASDGMTMQDPSRIITPEGRWAVMSGATLKATLEGWSRVSGWTLIWDNPIDYRIRASAVFEGDFETAVRSLVDAVHLVHPSLSATLYRGNRVVHVAHTGMSR